MMRHKNIKYAFSLVEVLISILIVSILIVALAPAITKRIAPRKSDGIVYTYRPGNKTGSDNICFKTGLESYANTNNKEEYFSSRDCSEYTFTVPDGVTMVNLTLVAGGGGGGGAAGGTIMEYAGATGEDNTDSNPIEYKAEDNFYPDLLRSVKINLLTGQGDAGGEVNKNCKESSTNCGGSGGASSPAIVNFDIPRSLMHGANYHGLLTQENNGSLTLTKDDNSASVSIKNDGNDSSEVIYSVKGTSEAVCKVADTEYKAGESGFSTACGVQDSNYKGSVSGMKGDNPAEGTTYYINDEFFGNKGASSQDDLTALHYGDGGKGGSLELIYCSSSEDVNARERCSSASHQYRTISSKKGGYAHAMVTYAVETPGGTGGGGAAGAVIRILGFPVTSGDTYKILVGKGGSGGSGGISSTSPTSGNAGQSGVSTAIYDKDENLIFMVNGGSAGKGGGVYSASDNTLWSAKPGESGRNFAKVFYGQDYSDYLYPDPEKMTAKSESSDNEKPDADKFKYAGIGILSYNALDKEPYSTLNLNGESNSDEKYGGFSAFTVHGETSNAYNNKYDGFYYRSLLDDEHAYIGGLGGFNGLGGKAGCGGYFLGNFDGRTSATVNDSSSSGLDTIRRAAIETFTLSDGTSYSVFDYFDNCTANSSNGQTSEFAAPSPVSLSYGQAGAGGGGGGYSIQNGAGKGGDGQDGYLMIDWRK